MLSNSYYHNNGYLMKCRLSCKINKSIKSVFYIIKDFFLYTLAFFILILFIFTKIFEEIKTKWLTILHLIIIQDNLVNLKSFKIYFMFPNANHNFFFFFLFQMSCRYWIFFSLFFSRCKEKQIWRFLTLQGWIRNLHYHHC